MDAEDGVENVDGDKVVGGGGVVSDLNWKRVSKEGG